MEPKIGDRVRATMNGEDWFTGIYVEESETFAQYGIKRDDMPNEVRFFTHAEKLPEAGMYAVNNPDYPQVKVFYKSFVRIGNFTICQQNEHGVWIQRGDTEEGGEVHDSVFEPFLAQFWKENF